MRKFLRTTAAVLVSCGSLVVAAVSASADHVACGDVITTDTTLDGDLVDCPGDGLIIGAPNITLDLNGHTIDGDPSALVKTGVLNPGYDGVTVKNGVIREFFHGVFLSGARSNVVTGLHITGAGHFGILLMISDGNVVSGNVVEGQLLSGILLSRQADFNAVSNNHVTRNHGTGISVSGTQNELSGNLVTDNRETGIHVTAEALDTLLVENAAHDNGWGTTRFDGIYVESSTTRLRGNAANNNGDYGIEAVTRLKGAVHNTASGNGNPEQCLNVNCR